MIDTRRIENFAQCIDYQFRHFPLSQSGSECNTVIIGENHNLIQRWCQERLIVMLKPKYVLIETFNKDKDLSDTWFQRWNEKYSCTIDRCDTDVVGFTGEPDQDDIRETRMGEIIIKFSKKSSKPIIVIIGNWHARIESIRNWHASRIHETLNGHIDYSCIWDQGAVIGVDPETRDYHLHNYYPITQTF